MQLTLAASALIVNMQCHLVAELSLDTPACPHDEDSGPGFQNMFCMQKTRTEKYEEICKLFFFLISSYQ